ncbi:MAG: RluA family pseudouridine synthase [Rhodobacteraceae bacterium]|nr:RluA family pseudouridine synthase [Paracoccaceae bacterium]
MTVDISTGEEDAGQRLDRWYRRRIGPVSQAHLERLCRQGQIRVDGRRVRCATRLLSGQAVRLPPNHSPLPGPDASGTLSAAHNQAGSVLANPLYEDDHFLAINKPAGLATQGGTGQHRHLDQILAGPDADGGRFRLIHRLDKATSGILLLGKTLPAVRAMGAMFQDRSVRKDYLAVTIRPPEPEDGVITICLQTAGRHHGVRWKRADTLAPQSGEKTAVTAYRTLRTSESGPALLALTPQTGRKHQLRAHLAAIGCPILGDRRYGITRDQRKAMPWHTALDDALHLHASSLEFMHPLTRRHIHINAPLSAHIRRACVHFGWPETYGSRDRVAGLSDGDAAG